VIDNYYSLICINLQLFISEYVTIVRVSQTINVKFYKILYETPHKNLNFFELCHFNTLQNDIYHIKVKVVY